MQKTLPKNAELLEVAKHVVWFEKSEDVLENPIFFALHVMRYGLWEDILIFRKYFTKQDIKQILNNAIAGILDKRSWLLWHSLVGNHTPPPMPTRQFG